MNSLLASLETAGPQPYRFGAKEFFALADAGIVAGRYLELVDGEIIELPSPGSIHGRYQGKIIFWLASVFNHHPDLWVGGDTAIEIDVQTVVGCDVVVASGIADTNALVSDQIVLAVEVSVSTTAYDLDRKKCLYARAEVAELWVVDPLTGTITTFKDPQNGDYRLTSVIRFGEPLAVPGTDRTIVIE